MYETTVTVVGRIASDVTSRRVGDDDQTVVSFRLVSTARRRDRVSGEWADGDEFSARVKCWRALGDGVLTSLSKGDPVVVFGRLSVQHWDTDAGRRYGTEISADAVGPDLNRSSAQVRRRRNATPDEDGVGSAMESAGLPPATGTDAGRAGAFSTAASFGVTTGTTRLDDDAEPDMDEQVGDLTAAV